MGADEDEDGSPTLGSIMGSALARPMGSKAAKEMRKEAHNTSGNVEKIRKDFNRLVNSALRKEAFDELSSLLKMYRSIGDVESARAVNSDLQDLIFASKMARLAEKEEDKKEKEKAKEPVDVEGGVPKVIDLGNADRNQAFASFDLEGVRLPPDDSSEFTDMLLERCQRKAEGKDDHEEGGRKNAPVRGSADAPSTPTPRLKE